MNNKSSGVKGTVKKRPVVPLKKVIKAVNENNGNISVTAKTLGCERKCIYRMMENNPELKGIIAKAREVILDEAEKSLLKSIQDGNVTSIIFALKTLGRSRGYVLNGYKPHELAAKINQSVLKKLTDEQLSELENLLKKKKDLSSFLRDIGLDAASD